MISLLDLPTEVILHILWFLDLADVLSCQLSHRSLHTTIKGSILLKYLSALKAAGMEDNRLCTVGSMSERLHMLNRREDAWTTHLIKFSRKFRIPVELELPWSYGLHGGMYFFEYSGDHSLHYVSLPLTISDNIHWSRIGTGIQIIGIGFAVCEHDLIAIATMPLDDNDRKTVDILLVEGSTGNRHPRAQNSAISIPRPYSSIWIRITGDHLILVTASIDGPQDRVDIYEWKTGILKMTITAPDSSYGDCLFLSPQVLLLPNKQNNTLELWDIPELPLIEPRTCPSSTLALPPVKYDIIEIICKSELFFGTYGAQSSSLPFYASSADAIAVFDFQIHFSQVTMFVHHRSLLNIHSKSLSSSPMPENSSARANMTPWDEWGPKVTRLLTGTGQTPRVYSGSANQRHVFSSGNSEITVLDFNPNRIQYLKQAFPKSVDSKWKDSPPLSIRIKESHLDLECFEKPVTSGLPFILHIFQSPADFGEIMIDDERLIGFRYDNEIAVLELFHIGQASSVEEED